MRRGAAAVVSVAVVTVVTACASTDEPRVTLRGDADASSKAPLWGASPCGQCVHDACADQRLGCATQPTCARNLDCIEACPALPDGKVDEACVATCPVVVGTAAESARDALVRCRSSGAGAACAACGGRRYRHPLLGQRCPSTVADKDPYRACVATHCCETQAACARDLACQGFRDCTAACPTAVCEEQCYLTIEAGVVPWRTHLACALAYCVQYLDDVTTCSKCSDPGCADEIMTCRTDRECNLLSACIATCRSPACIDACQKNHPSAIGTFDAELVCARERCPSCG